MSKVAFLAVSSGNAVIAVFKCLAPDEKSLNREMERQSQEKFILDNTLSVDPEKATSKPWNTYS
jgi:hypothetical protein